VPEVLRHELRRLLGLDWWRPQTSVLAIRSDLHDFGMPRISEFYGIAIAMYYAEHGVPHFHALYAGRDASIAIETLEVSAGRCPTARYGSSGSGRRSIVRRSRRTGGGSGTASRSIASHHCRSMRA